MIIGDLKPGDTFLDCDGDECILERIEGKCAFGWWFCGHDRRWTGPEDNWSTSDSATPCELSRPPPHGAEHLLIQEGKPTLKIKEIRPNCAPKRMTPGAAGYDLFNGDALAELQEGDTVKFSTGFAVQLPAGHVGIIRPRSGLGFGHGVTVLAGVIDEDFRGEVRVALHRVVTRGLLYRISEKITRWVYRVVDKHLDGVFLSIADTVKTDTVEIKTGDRIAQLLVLPCYQGEPELVDELDETERGSGGYGSTGQ